ncbi:hypothetical protein [Roseobacter sp.]
MREMFFAGLAMMAISVGAFYGLHAAGFSAAERGSSPAVRLGD